MVSSKCIELPKLLGAFASHDFLKPTESRVLWVIIHSIGLESRRIILPKCE